MGFFGPTAWVQGGKDTGPGLPECGRCGLYKTCRSPRMPPSGKGNLPILFVGEAPGRQEDKLGKQFVGESGQLLRKTLRRFKVKLDDCWKTNAAICRPPNNKIQDTHIASCRANLRKTIEELQPRVIVLLGGSAVRSLLPTEREASVGSITRWVGWSIPSQKHRAWLCPTYHPAYVLRSPKDKVLRKLFTDHLRQAVKLVKKPVPHYDLDKMSSKVERITHPRDARLRLRDLGKRKGILSWDYESTGLKPEREGHKIVCVSFCLRGEDAWSMMYNPDVHRAPLRKVLRRRELLKVASNLKHEERWSRHKLKTRVRPWYWDVMLAAHVLDNRPGITSLKFSVYRFFGIADYDGPVSHYMQADKRGFNRITECPPGELLLYNGLDSLFTDRVMLVQRKQMGLSTP